jgi:DNA-binding PadR family transcriptional regulator
VRRRRVPRWVSLSARGRPHICAHRAAQEQYGRDEVRATGSASLATFRGTTCHASTAFVSKTIATGSEHCASESNRSYGRGVLRIGGSGLTRNESRLLAASLRLSVEGVVDLYGYELFATLTRWEGGVSPMNHGTVYRCLRNLYDCGHYSSGKIESERHPGRTRVYYRLTDQGAEAARKATVRFAGEEQPPSWIDVHNILVPLKIRPSQ